ncbi:DUF2637 domain-containing protein [Nonomuraea sp. NPDC005650]|uniref:DUF2637 domain-containing protein n=1 Tax=Nonomuraea sp. NPDC005650 TaxID=3157045 RepID=UPI0033A33768
MEPSLLAVRHIQRTTIGGVVVLAGIAAVVSFRHMHELRLRHDEDYFAAVLIPLAGWSSSVWEGHRHAVLT